MDSQRLIEQSDSRTESAIFEMHPVGTDQIKATADRGGFLPPKSSWVEPKLRSGLFPFMKSEQTSIQERLAAVRDEVPAHVTLVGRQQDQTSRSH